MHFQVVGQIEQIETFATGSGIRELARLRKIYGRGRWRKRKGVATVRPSGMIRSAWSTSLAKTTSIRRASLPKSNFRSRYVERSPQAPDINFELQH